MLKHNQTLYVQNHLFKSATIHLHTFPPPRPITPHGIYQAINCILSSPENDDMESPKCCAKLLLLIFILKWFCSKENSTTRRARGCLKQMYSFAMFTLNWRIWNMFYVEYICTFPTPTTSLPLALD